jgi:hypothetical protein
MTSKSYILLLKNYVYSHHSWLGHFQSIWNHLEIRLNIEITSYIVFKNVLDILYSLDSFQTSSNVPMID